MLYKNWFSKVAKRSIIITLLRIATVTLVVIFLTGASETAKAIDTGDLKMYGWNGFGTESYFKEQDFNTFFLSAVKIKETKIDYMPSKEEILKRIKDVDVIYANTHIGQETGRLITGPGDAPQDEITIPEIGALYENSPRLPSLVIINGCKSVRSELYNINEKGFQITDKTRGRAYIGLSEEVTGKCGDAFFRVFFALWTKTPDITLEQAKKSTVDFFKRPLPERQDYLGKEWKEDPGLVKSLLMYAAPGCPPEKIGGLMSIIGDKNLAFNDLLSQHVASEEAQRSQTSEYCMPYDNTCTPGLNQNPFGPSSD